MNGADYIAQTEIYDKPRDIVVAEPGKTCERVDPRSLPWLLEQGYIVPRLDTSEDSFPLGDEEA